MENTTPLFTDDTIGFGLLRVALGFIFYTESRPSGFWHKFYKIVPGLFMAYMIPAVLTTAPSSARLPNKIDRPPTGEKAFSLVWMMLVSLISASLSFISSSLISGCIFLNGISILKLIDKTRKSIDSYYYSQKVIF